MSRWIEAFETHAFQTTWGNLKAALEQASVDDETIVTSVQELARLKKVVSYLDEIINGIDPELVPLTTWDNFNTQVATSLQQIEQYNDNRNIGHIQKANTYVDNLLSYVRPYMVAPDDVGKALQEAVKSYAKTIGEYGESFRNKSNELVLEVSEHSVKSKKLLDFIQEAKNEVDQFREELFGEGDNAESAQSKVNKLVDDFEKKHGDIVDYYNETLVGTANTSSTKKEIADAKEAISNDRVEIGNLLEDVSAEVNDLHKFYLRIFGKTNDLGEVESGLANELNVRIKALEDFEGKQKNKYQALNEQIENLLPGATSAGLASAYHDMKVSFDNPIKNASLVFYVAIGGLVLASMLLAIDSVGFWQINFVKIGSWDEVLKSVVNKLPFYAPILWLAFYASKRRSEYQRLQQEYAHKEALAKSYDSYKKQIEELEGEDFAMQKAFIMKAIDAIAYNASSTLDGKHGDKMPIQDVIEKLVEKMSKVSEQAATKKAT